MTFQRVAFLASIFLSTQHLEYVSAFGVNPLSSNNRQVPLSVTSLRESGSGSPESSAATRAAELKRKAEDAKRKAEELKRVAETKAAAAMKAVKQANDNCVGPINHFTRHWLVDWGIFCIDEANCLRSPAHQHITDCFCVFFGGIHPKLDPRHAMLSSKKENSIPLSALLCMTAAEIGVLASV